MAVVADILNHKGREVVTVSPVTTVVEAARRMNEAAIGGVVVMDGTGVVGIFTERDVLRRVVAEGRDPSSTAVADVMTRNVVTIRTQDSLGRCSAIITAKRIRHIPVVDDHDLCGIVTSGDILAHQAREQQETIDYLNSYVHDLR